MTRLDSALRKCGFLGLSSNSIPSYRAFKDRSYGCDKAG